MPYNDPNDDWTDDANDVSDDFDDDDDDSIDGSLLMCPSCRRSVHEDTQKCPHCGDWITPAYPGSWKRWVWTVTAILVVASMILMTVF